MRARVTLIGLLVAASMLLEAPPLFAQNRRWADPYERGVKALTAGRHQEAITQLERAVAVEPKSGANKYVEGVFSIDYFPYVYLGLAYLQTNQYDKARENFEKARKDKMPNALSARLTDGEKQLSSALSARATPAPAAPPTAPAPPARNPTFDRALRQAEASLEGRQYDAALKALDSLKSLDAAEYSRQNLQARRDEAAGSWARQLADEATRLLQDGKLTDAKARLHQADQMAPAQKSVQDALAEIRNREDSYQRLKTAAGQDTNTNNLTGARDKYQQAQKIHPEQFAADNLETQLAAVVQRLASPAKPAVPAGDAAQIGDASRQLFENGRRLAGEGRYRDAEAAYSGAIARDPKNQPAAAALESSRRFADQVNQSRLARKRNDVGGAIQRLQDAKTLDAQRFDREKLAAELDALIAATAGDPESKALREALLALLRGDAKGSSDVLEPLVTKPRNPKSMRLADLQAYLGVAYATRALTATRQEDQQELRGKAIEYFRLARSARRDYRLSARLVSPRIVAMFDEARP